MDIRFELSDLNKAVETLKRGGIILYPTDTVWGIGCDATNPDAVKKVYDIKHRSDSKALITLVPNEAWIERYVKEVPEIAWELIEAAVDPITIIYDEGKNLAANLFASDGSIGIRVTRDRFCQALCNALKKPIVSTSANISGSTTPSLYSEISGNIINAVDYVVKWRRADSSPHKPSGVIKISKGGVFKILR